MIAVLALAASFWLFVWLFGLLGGVVWFIAGIAVIIAALTLPVIQARRSRPAP